MSFEQAKDESKERLAQVKVIIWDIDGTLYQDRPQLKKALREDVLKRVSKKLGVDEEEAGKILEKNYKKYSSSTQALLALGFNWEEARERLEECFEIKKKFLKRDSRLVEMFNQLADFRHLIASNNPEDLSSQLLNLLGLDLVIFEKIFGNAPGIIKPDLVFFKRILEYTGLPAREHLMVGDREETELIPAQKLGMKTAMVWGQSKIADISLPTVYSLADFLIKTR